ncbi:MAG TPA: DUF3786 domain-containing protein [Thermodesulfobacteriaceae bacterium]|nr:DUF3786 domain-containing protein [Thermodesulfobacteriaceae bacterium]
MQVRKLSKWIYLKRGYGTEAIMVTTIFDLVRQTPKTNCGECGLPTCMAFAAAVLSEKARPDQCPYFPEDFIIEKKIEESAVAGPDASPETVLLAGLQAKVKGIDLAARAEGLGGIVVEGKQGMSMQIAYLNELIQISSEVVKSAEGKELDPRDQILLYNYLFFNGKGPLSNEWVGLESFPNSISKVVTLRKYAEDKLALAFQGKPARLKTTCMQMGGQHVDPCHADLCIHMPVLPKLPLKIHFWDADCDDGFPAKVKILYDARAVEFLDLESLVFAAERMVERIVGASA